MNQSATSDAPQALSPLKALLMVIPTIVFYVFVLGVGALNATIAMVIVFLGFGSDASKRLGHRVVCVWGVCVLWALRLIGFGRVRYEDFDKLKGFEGVILVNHQSQLDIVTMQASFHNFRWVSKRSMFRVPFIGWAMKIIGYIGLKRGEAESIKQMIVDCRASVSDGFSVVIFPEGTRSSDGKLLPFKVGGFSIAKKVKAPIALLTNEGSHDSLPPRVLLFRKRLNITLRVREILQPEDYKTIKTKDLMALVEGKYHDWLGEPLAAPELASEEGAKTSEKSPESDSSSPSDPSS